MKNSLGRCSFPSRFPRQAPILCVRIWKFPKATFPHGDPTLLPPDHPLPQAVTQCHGISARFKHMLSQTVVLGISVFSQSFNFSFSFNLVHKNVWLWKLVVIFVSCSEISELPSSSLWQMFTSIQFVCYQHCVVSAFCTVYFTCRDVITLTIVLKFSMKFSLLSKKCLNFSQ